MFWDESDSDIQAKLTELQDQKENLETQLRQIISYQHNIGNLRMVKTADTVTTFVLPTDYSGNTIDSDYRDTQKAALIANINEFLSINDTNQV